MTNVIAEYMKKYPVTSTHGALYVLELSLTSFFAYKTATDFSKSNALLMVGFGALATSMVAREGLI